jgi:hypothetical protein
VPGYIHFVPTGRKKYAALGVSPAGSKNSHCIDSEGEAGETPALPAKACHWLGPSTDVNSDIDAGTVHPLDF